MQCTQSLVYLSSVGHLGYLTQQDTLNPLLCVFVLHTTGKKGVIVQRY